MKQPRKPNRPYPPKEPELMVSFFDTICQEEVYDGQQLLTVLEKISRKSNYTIEEIIKNSCFNFVTYSCSNDDIYLELNIHKEQPNPNYQKDLKKYQKDLIKYNQKLEEYNQKLVQYKLDMEAYKVHLKQVKQEEKQKQIEKAQEFLRKEGLI